MRLSSFALVIPAMCVLASMADRADACGGCFHEPPMNMSQSTQVTGHQMVLSVSQQQTTLWDEISYVGDAMDFAWVLPVKGTVEIGLSSDLVFTTLGAATGITITSPTYQCSDGTSGAYGSGTCDTTGVGGGSAAAGGGLEGTDGETVTVTAQQVIGPYETVQLSSQSATALQDWLIAHGYDIPADISPVIDAYVQEGFDFLAMRLAPGQGVDAMRPVRVTWPGSDPTLPLRMVAAGTGAKTAIDLWVLGETRFAPKGFETFEIAESDLVWDFDQMRSNWAETVQAGFDAGDQSSWLVAAAEPMSVYDLSQSILGDAKANLPASGYGDVAEALADTDHLVGSIAPASAFVTRLAAMLPRPALAGDLVLEPVTPTTVTRDFFLTSYVGSPPCPVFAKDCYSGSGFGAGGGGASANGDASNTDSGCACAVATDGQSPWGPLALVGIAAVVLAARRRSRRPSLAS